MDYFLEPYVKSRHKLCSSTVHVILYEVHLSRSRTRTLLLYELQCRYLLLLPWEKILTRLIGPSPRVSPCVMVARYALPLILAADLHAAAL